MKKSSLLVAANLALCIAIVPVSRAQAQEALVQAPLVLLLTDDAPSREQILLALNAQLSELDTPLVVLPPSSESASPASLMREAAKVHAERGALAVIWIDESTANSVFLYLSSAKGDRFLARRMDEPDAPARFEALAIIVRTAVRTIQQGGLIGEVVPAEPLASPVVPASRSATPQVFPPQEPTPTQTSLGAALAYVAVGDSDQQPFLQGVDASLRICFRRLVAMHIGYTQLSPARAESDFGRFILRRHPLRLGLEALLPRDRFEFSLSAALIVDFTSFEMEDISSFAKIPRDRTDVLVSAALGLTIRLRLAAHLVLFGLAGAELAAKSLTYTALTPTGSSVILDPWPVAPWLGAGFEVRFF